MYLYNSMTSSVEEFIPHNPNEVTMYVCGPTVYDRAHIGNARPAVVFDILYRVLQFKYLNVKYARNFTDIDDKIMDRANKEKNNKSINDSIYELTNKTIDWYHEDMQELNVKIPTYEPRATDHIHDMINMIQKLVDRNHAYVANNTVLFDVKSFHNHGKLSKRIISEQIVGDENELATYKKSPEDFVLWKPSTPEQPSWESPWGAGRPGWHIECSAMIKSLFGNHIDIHGGGIDLLFPHHENEISQSCASCDNHTELAKYWVHNNFVTVNNEKMSKSVGNFFTVKDLLQAGISGQVIRFVLLKTHYRNILKWSDMAIEEATAVLNKWNDLVKDVVSTEITADLIEPLFDDLNTPLLIAKMHDYANNKKYPELKAIMYFIGLNSNIDTTSLNDAVEKVINLRLDAKSKKRYALSDDIRATLIDHGIEINDKKDKTEWKIRKKITKERLEEIHDFYYGVLYV